MLVSETGPPALSMAPPINAELSDRVVLAIIVSVPCLTKMPPPRPVVVLYGEAAAADATALPLCKDRPPEPDSAARRTELLADGCTVER